MCVNDAAWGLILLTVPSCGVGTSTYVCSAKTKRAFSITLGTARGTAHALTLSSCPA